jgi:hypothetical protein
MMRAAAAVLIIVGIVVSSIAGMMTSFLPAGGSTAGLAMGMGICVLGAMLWRSKDDLAD